MTYEYECPDGHLTEVVRPAADPEPGTVPCRCGLPARRIVSRSVTFLTVGATGKLRNTDSVERLYGPGHVEALAVQKETTEWLTAIGAADGHTGDAKSACMLPTAQGVREKKEMVRAGVKPPESVTFGLKKEFVDSIGR